MDQRKSKEFSRGVAVRLLIKLPREISQVTVKRQSVNGKGPRRDIQQRRCGRTDCDTSDGIAKCHSLTEAGIRDRHHSEKKIEQVIPWTIENG